MAIPLPGAGGSQSPPAGKGSFQYLSIGTRNLYQVGSIQQIGVSGADLVFTVNGVAVNITYGGGASAAQAAFDEILAYFDGSLGIVFTLTNQP